MSRKIIIDKQQGNTHYSVSIIDSYDTEHHLGYIAGSKIDDLTTQICGEEQDILSQQLLSIFDINITIVQDISIKHIIFSLIFFIIFLLNYYFYYLFLYIL